MTYSELKPTIADLQNGAAGQKGPVTVEDSKQKVAKAEHSNGHRKGYDTVIIRRFLIDGKPVSVVEAAKAILA